jgi:hypothetical protein
VKKKRGAQPGNKNGRTHGMKSLPEYATWRSMRTRCKNPLDHAYPWYGGRGISVCDRWDSFVTFLDDMGRRPSPYHSIDRINNDGNYEQSNCRWATADEQNNNKSCGAIVDYLGTTVTLHQAVRSSGKVVSVYCARARLKRGWPMPQAVELPTSGRVVIDLGFPT